MAIREIEDGDLLQAPRNVHHQENYDNVQSGLSIKGQSTAQVRKTSSTTNILKPVKKSKRNKRGLNVSVSPESSLDAEKDQKPSEMGVKVTKRSSKERFTGDSQKN